MTRVTVFGGSTPTEKGYEQALQLGRRLGEKGYTVLTGGYIGTMEAVSRGAAECGGHVIGVTCTQIENWRQVRPNDWVMEEKRFITLRERIMALIEECDAMLALPGGVGTLAEITLAWNHLLTDAISPRPLIVVGAAWQAHFENFINTFSDYISLDQRRWISFAPDVEGAMALLAEKLLE